MSQNTANFKSKRQIKNEVKVTNGDGFGNKNALVEISFPLPLRLNFGPLQKRFCLLQPVQKEKIGHDLSSIPENLPAKLKLAYIIPFGLQSGVQCRV